VSEAPLRVRLASPTTDPDGGLPFRILIIADAVGRPLEAPLGVRQPLPLARGGVAALLHALHPEVAGVVPDLIGHAAACTYRIAWSGADGPDRAACIVGISGLAELERRRCDPAAPAVERALLAEGLDAQIAALREQPAMRRMEALWRSLALLADHAGGEVELALLPATRDELRTTSPMPPSPVPPACSAPSTAPNTASTADGRGACWSPICASAPPAAMPPCCAGSPPSPAWRMRRCCATPRPDCSVSPTGPALPS